MANKYAGTQTEKNLMAAFSGESEARNKYTYFASKAKKEGFEQIAALFLKTADNEKEHAKLWFKELGLLGDTAENLASAAAGERPAVGSFFPFPGDLLHQSTQHVVAEAVLPPRTGIEGQGLPRHSPGDLSRRCTAARFADGLTE